MELFSNLICFNPCCHNLRAGMPIIKNNPFSGSLCHRHFHVCFINILILYDILHYFNFFPKKQVFIAKSLILLKKSQLLIFHQFQPFIFAGHSVTAIFFWNYHTETT